MRVQYGRDTHEFDEQMTVRRLLERLEIVPEGVIVVVGGELVTSDTMLEVNADVEIVRAISGGARGARR